MKLTKLLYLLIISFCYLPPVITYAQQGSMDWTLANDFAGWISRSSHASVVFDGKLWVIGGYGYNEINLNDVWYSYDGVVWTIATEHALWTARRDHKVIVFNNRMWLLGGFDGSYKNDVWYSYDGAHWTCVTSSAAWPVRDKFAVEVFDDKMWVFGGYNNTTGRFHDVWFSTDGINWTQATAAAGWSARYGLASTIFDNKLWIFGGYAGPYERSQNDVWHSSDGTNWAQATANAGWSARCLFTSVTFDNKIWVMGGSGTSYNNDVWYTYNGINWTCAINLAPWPIRNGHTSIIYNNKIFLMGGFTYYGYRNDVWYSRGVRFNLVTPNSGEFWPGGSQQIIKWRTFGDSFFGYRLLFSQDSGLTYPNTLASNILPSETTYNWTIPLINSTACRILLQILNSNNTVVGQDVSDSNFTVRTIKVVTPNGSETWYGGGYQTIKWWKTPNLTFFCYRIFLSKNGGVSFQDLIADNVSPSETTYNWNVPLINFTTCRILIQMLDSSESVISEDTSDMNFTIRTAPTIVSPNGGEIWNSGSEQIIKWRADGIGFAGFRLLLSRNSGSSCFDTIIHYTQPSETTYNWTIPPINSNSCRLMVQILDRFGSVISQDASDANFSIRTAPTVVFPNGGETLPGGSQQMIRWQTIGTGFARFRILFARNYIFNDTIAHNVSPDETTYNWTIPTINSNRCIIMVQMIDSSSSIISYDYSNGYFTIITTGIEEFAILNSKCNTLEISPNPVKSLTAIRYSLLAESKVTLQLCDISGRLVKTLVNENKKSGNYYMTINTKTLFAGVYFLSFQTESKRIIERVVMVK